jgi:hypothetical protein
MHFRVHAIMVWAIIASFGIAQNDSNPAPAASAPTRPPPPPQVRDFDFWVGEWEVRTSDGKLAGFNHIESILGGRVLQENYHTANRAYSGKSFNIYNAAEKRWEQYWVDVTGLALHLKGGLNAAGHMVLQGERQTMSGTMTIDRITWSQLEDGVVRQLWETSSDGGETWAVAFDGRYRRTTESE